MQIVSWNVNSIRARLERVVPWLEDHLPEVVCLQETKSVDEAFPVEPFEELGYRVTCHGQKTYNGVATLTRGPLEEVLRGFDDGEEEPQARLLAGTYEGVRILNAYVPNGKEVGTDKWSYKLAWLERLRGYLVDRCDPKAPLVLCGDFNIAPDDRDVAKPEQWADSVLCHPEVRASLQRLLDWGLADAQRLHSEEGGFYSWWDYRQLAFPKNDGLRIDLHLLTAPAAGRCTGVEIDREARKGQKPSDHAPVILTLGD
ncbi:MAG: exodeoxyribonuclease III [Deltaproteobacteria bacterium]|nr:exodeoxyribonuclease III [Deltaproteobacteria bacterium]